MENTISIKGQNYNYAPGLATYAMDGKIGDQGLNGNNIFYTNILIAADWTELIKQIKNNYYPLKNNTEKIGRQYQAGDVFFDKNGVIWQLTGYSKIIGLDDSSVYGIIDDYFKQVGQIKLNESIYMSIDENTGRAILNTSTYKGFDIITGTADWDLANENMPMNVISDIIDGDDNIQLMQFSAMKDSILSNGMMKIYFDTTTNTFHLYSEKPIMVDTDIELKDNLSTDYDGYSKILTSNDTLSVFKDLCDQLTYDITVDTNNIHYLDIMAKDNNLSDAEKRDLLSRVIAHNDNVYAKIYDGSMNQYMVKLDSNIKLYSNTHSITKCTLTNLPTVNSSIDVSFYNYNGTFNSSINYSYEYSSKSLYSTNLDISTASSGSLRGMTIVVGLYRGMGTQGQTASFQIPELTFTVGKHNITNDGIIHNFSFTAPPLLRDNYSLRMVARMNGMPKFSENIVDVPLIDTSAAGFSVEPGNEYTIYYTGYSNSTGNIGVNIEMITPSLDPYANIAGKPINEPTISTVISSAISDVKKTSLIHNTEVFLQELQ